jgi:dienelactone hydrolase
MRLTVEPTEGPVDEPPAITVTRAPPGATVTLEVRTVDAAGHRWRSATRFRAGEDGVVDTSRDPPVDGPQHGVDSALPLWAMEFASDDEAPVAFVAPADRLDYVLEARADGEGASERIVRRWMADVVRREQLRGDGSSGPLFLPAGDGAAPAVLLVLASTGVGALEPEAALLASHGYCAFVAGYTQEQGLPPSLREIPVEVLLTASRALAAHGRVDGERIGWIAASVGTQGALAALALADAPQVRCAVAIAPSSVVWQALPENGAHRRRPRGLTAASRFPWLPIHGERLLPEIVRHKVLARFSRHPRPQCAPPASRLRAVASRPGCRHASLDPGGADRLPAANGKRRCRRDVARQRDVRRDHRATPKPRSRPRGPGSCDSQTRATSSARRSPRRRSPWSADLVSGGTAQGNAHRPGRSLDRAAGIPRPAPRLATELSRN